MSYQVVTEMSTYRKDKVFDSKSNGYSYTLKCRTNISTTRRCSYRSSKIICLPTVCMEAKINKLWSQYEDGDKSDLELLQLTSSYSLVWCKGLDRFYLFCFIMHFCVHTV